MAKVREIPWPQEYSDLKRIEEFMICGICYEYMETSVITPCSHNYCSLCIRKYLHYKAQCPACFHVFFEKDLYVNRAMDGLIQHYLQVREKLISIIENRAVYNTVKREEETPSTPPVRPVRISQLPKSPQVQEIQQSEPKTPTVSSSFASTSNCISSPITSRSPKIIPTIARIFNTPKRKESGPQPINVNTKAVSCPVCCVDISEHHINVHLDACLRREVGQAKEKITTSKRPPLPKLVLRVMKDAQLRKKMKEIGLSTQGDRKTLENRFTRYTTIYNAECDKLEPRPIADLIRQCEMDEKQERKMDCFLVSASTTTNRLQIERNAKEEKIEEAQKIYRLSNKSSFDKLIEEVKNRRKMEKMKQNNDESNCDNEPSTSTSESIPECISENEENTSYKPPAEIAFQDSDSDEPCPLQYYKSDEPTKYLSVNFDDASSSTGISTKESSVKKSQNSTKTNFQTEESKVSENFQNIIYELSTDDSSDNEILNSPVLNKNLNRKRVKLSNKSLNKSHSFGSSAVAVTSQYSEKENKETIARDLCNSIIDDFSCYGQSDHSSNEFADKRPKENVKNQVIIVNKPLENVNDSNNLQIQEKADSSCDKEKTKEDEIALDKELNNLVNNFSFNILNADNSCDLLNKSIKNSDEVVDHDINETSKVPSHLNGVNEKENNASFANENCKAAINQVTICRPVRKRNRPLRFSELKSNQENNEKLSNKQSEESHENESSDDLTTASSDGSLKRRRGRAKVHSVDNPSDETQNPPKRPVRRRQPTSDNNLS